MHRDLAVLPGWAAASALPKEAPTQLNAPSTFPTESLLEPLLFIQFIFPGEEALLAKVKRILWNTTVNAGVATVDKRSIDEGIPRYTSTTSLPQDYLDEDGACVWFAKRRTLLAIRLGCIAAPINLDAAYDVKL